MMTFVYSDGIFYRIENDVWNGESVILLSKWLDLHGMSNFVL